MPDFLGLRDRTVVVTGVANRRSVAFHTARLLEAHGVRVVYSVHSAQRRESVARLLPGREIHVCDVQRDDEIASLAQSVQAGHPVVHGLLHSVAFANYQNFTGVFHEVSRADFLQAMDVSCYSLIALARAFQPLLATDASVVTISISSTRMAAESYGYMAPAKAALNASLAFLAKSFSRFSQVRFNAVGAGPLKTAASAGIPGYLDSFLFAEQATLRKQALTAEETARVAAFLLGPCSSGINAQVLITDCGMETNYFDADIVRHVTRGAWPVEEPGRTQDAG